MNRQVKFGAIFSYILIFLNATYGIFLTPFILNSVGEVSYGVYKTISSLTSAFMVIDSGVGAAVMRYVAKYRADEREDKIPNFLFMGMCQTLIIAGIILALTTGAYFFIDEIYAGSLSAGEITEAKGLYVFLALGMVAHIGENFINGIISGYNRFGFANGCKIIRLMVRIFAIILLVGIFKNTIVLVLVDLFCTLAFIIVELVYIRLRIKTKIKYSSWDGAVFKELFIYIGLMLLGTLVDQVNSNISNVIVGANIGATAVTIYSMAILIFTMYMNISTAISGVMLPTVTMTLKQDDEMLTRTTDLIVKVGRIQFLLLGAVATGFVVLGMPFVRIWLGEGFEDVYFLTNILLFPALLELCINVCLAVLRAKNMLKFRTAIIAVSACINIVVMLISMPYIGYFGASIGTACSYFFGSVVIMGVYYYKRLKINIVRAYIRIFKGILPSIALSGIASYFASSLVSGDIPSLAVGIPSFCVVYAITLILFGLNKDEKNAIFGKLRRNKK